MDIRHIQGQLKALWQFMGPGGEGMSYSCWVCGAASSHIATMELLHYEAKMKNSRAEERV